MRVDVDQPRPRSVRSLKSFSKCCAAYARAASGVRLIIGILDRLIFTGKEYQFATRYRTCTYGHKANSFVRERVRPT